MQSPNKPDNSHDSPPQHSGNRNPNRRPLTTISLLVGIVFSAFAITAAIAPKLVAALLSESLFARALGVTFAMAGAMLARVAIRTAFGWRRAAGVVIAAPLVATAIVLVVSPSLATWFHDTGHKVFVPWIFGIPAVGALLLGRWRDR